MKTSHRMWKALVLAWWLLSANICTCVHGYYLKVAFISLRDSNSVANIRGWYLIKKNMVVSSPSLSFWLLAVLHSKCLLPYSCKRAPMGGATYKSRKEGGGHSFKCFHNLTTNEHPHHVYSKSMPWKQIIEQTIIAEPPAALKLSPDGTQHSEWHHVSSSWCVCCISCVYLWKAAL